jgi:fatty acid CoA ligase FadD9
MAPRNRFRAAVEGLNVPPGEGIPHVTPAIIVKYVTGLELLGLL